jgi:hypothetical protein
MYEVSGIRIYVVGNQITLQWGDRDSRVELVGIAAALAGRLAGKTPNKIILEYETAKAAEQAARALFIALA